MAKRFVTPQIESAWPAPGSVLIDGGIGYIASGRHPMCEGGVQVIAFKPRTGELVWETATADGELVCFE